MSSKISKSLGVLTRLRHFVPTRTLLSKYRSLTQPYITYRIAVWDQTAQTNLGSWYLFCKNANLFLEPSQVHSYNTRFSETGRLDIKYSWTNHLNIHFLDLVQEFGIVFLKVSQYFLSTNLRLLYISSFYIFKN